VVNFTALAAGTKVTVVNTAVAPYPDAHVAGVRAA